MTTATTAMRGSALSPLDAARPPAMAVPESAGRATEFSAAIIRDEPGFAALEADWRALERRAPEAEYFASFDWSWCWWRHFGAGEGASPMIVTLRRAGDLVAVMPLAVHTAGPYSYAVLMGAGTGQYGDILVDPALAGGRDLHAALWHALRETGADTFQVDNVRADSVLAAFLAPVRKSAGTAEIAYEVATADYPDFDAYMATRSVRQRKDLRRRRRRLAEEGAVSYGLVTADPAIGEVTGAAAALKRQWLAERGLHGRFLSREGVDDWFADVSRRANASGRLHLSVLRVGGRLAAAQLAFISAQRLVGYFAAFDVAHARHSVGKLHLEDHLAEVFASRRTLDLLPPADDYKTEWARPGVTARSYCVPLSARGRLVTIFHNPRHREFAKQIYLGLPRAVRATIASRGMAAAGRLRRSISGRRRTAAATTTMTAKEQKR